VSETTGFLVQAQAGLGVLHQLAGVIAEHQGDIVSVEILENGPQDARTYFEIVLPSPIAALERDLRALSIVKDVKVVNTFQRIFGKRVIIVGGGAQVGQVAIGAISEADRHNIRGEHISVDTIPLVGEQPLAEAVRAVARLPRAKAIVMAGALMGGEIEQAVKEVRQTGLLVISLNMAGSGRPRGQRPRAGRRDGGDGGRRHGQIHRRATQATAVLAPTARSLRQLRVNAVFRNANIAAHDSRSASALYASCGIP
jgi:energy-converting hydrogenase B subunit Q